MDRRRFLAFGRGAAVSGGLFLSGLSSSTRRVMAAGGTKEELEHKLADFALGIKFGELPNDVVASAKRVLLDAVGCAFGAVGSEPAVIAEDTIRKTFGQGQAATILGYPNAASVEGAIFVNGVLVRALDLNDTYIGTDPLHPSEVLPTALALVEEAGGSGRDLIEAIVAGYEVSARVNDGISFMERGFHPLCAASYGIPVIAGKVWGLSRDALANAVGISGARGFTSFVVNSGAISMMKSMGLAATAADGVFVTRLAQRGFTGPSGTLEWMASRIKPEKQGLVVDLEHSRYRLPQVAFKRFPIQIELQAVAEIGSTLFSKIRGETGKIRSISVETYPGIIERVADPAKFKPSTKGTADHSLPVCLAMALLDGDVTIAQFEKNRWQAADVLALVNKISVRPSEALMTKLPRGRGATVEITLSDGTQLRETLEVAEGDAQRPLSRASLERKFTNFATPVVGNKGAERVIQLVEGLESIKNIRELTATLVGPGKQNPI